ncbi:hypothetical protein EON77_01795 [bacterium]|nr:MAG: hypothetical protein EON77_01795 [bacterium]
MTSLRLQRLTSVVACGALILPGLILAGCGSGGAPSAASAPPIDASRGGYAPPPTSAPPRQGMSTGKKVALLAGAAALYYMYRKNQQKKQAGQLQGQPQYYLSKNGRVYYRQPNGQAVWVTPPSQPIPVPYDEAQQYSQYQGYDGRSSGRTLQDLYNEGSYAQDPRGAYSGGR